MNGKEEKAKGIVVTPKPAEALASSAIHAFVAVQDAATLGSQVLDYLGIRGERRKSADKIIGKGGMQAERLPVLLVAEQMRDERKWRWFTFGVGLAGVLLSFCSLLVAASSLILSVILSLIRSGGPLR